MSRTKVRVELHAYLDEIEPRVKARNTNELKRRCQRSGFDPCFTSPPWASFIQSSASHSQASLSAGLLACSAFCRHSSAWRRNLSESISGITLPEKPRVVTPNHFDNSGAREDIWLEGCDALTLNRTRDCRDITTLPGCAPKPARETTSKDGGPGHDQRARGRFN
jgi:hypothetical protein